MVLAQVDKHQGAGRVEQMPPERRSLEALAARFTTFAVEECAGESGLNVFAPTYGALAHYVASDPELLSLARECGVGQPIPNLFLSAVKRVLADHPDAELSRHYARAADGESPDASIGAAFAGFCARYRDAIADLVRVRRVQTNEIRRCAYLMPAFGVIARESSAPLALIDVGASAGLNLLWDSYRYAYSDGSRYGPANSPALIESETRTPMPDIPARLPPVAYRVGIDLNPVDLSDDEEYRWMMALVWPDHPDRSALLSAARSIWLDDPPKVLPGDAIDTLPQALADATNDDVGDATLCVFHCHTLNQFPVDARAAFYDILRAESERRTIYHVPSEGERMSVDRIEEGEATTLLSARRNAHGRWIEWERSE